MTGSLTLGSTLASVLTATVSAFAATETAMRPLISACPGPAAAAAVAAASAAAASTAASAASAAASAAEAAASVAAVSAVATPGAENVNVAPLRSIAIPSPATTSAGN